MIAYEIQLQYVIQDKIQSEKESEKKNFIRKKNLSKKISEKKLSQMVSWISSVQSELSRTNNAYHH